MFYLPAYGGANRCNRILLEGLAERKHLCWAVARSVAAQGSWSRKQFLDQLAANGISVISSSSEADIFNHKGVRVHAVINASQLRDQLIQQTHELDPNWLIVSSEDPGQSLLETALQLRPGRVIYMAHAPQLFPFGPASFSPNSAGTKLLRKVAGIVAIGSRTADYFQQYSGLKPVVIHPPIYGSGPFPDYGSFSEGFITIVNPSAVKGISIFIELARRFSDYKFAALLGWSTTNKDREALAELCNVKSYESVEHIDELFAKTRVLLVPSLYQEGFGLVATEAMLRGIPVLASNYGGLVEAKLGVDYLLPIHPIGQYEDRCDDRNFPVPLIPNQDIAPWVEALQKLLSNRDHYSQLSKVSRKAALAFVSNLGIEPFEELLLNLVPMDQANLSSTRDTTKDQGSKMSGLLARIDNLSPDRRALLDLRLTRRKNRSSKKQTIACIPRSRGQNAFPLSFAQQRLWLVDQLEPDNPVYNIWQAYRIVGKLDVTALEQSLNGIVRRHETLRTTFEVADGLPIQIIAPTLSLTMHVVDLRDVPETQREAEAKLILTEETGHIFDLTKGPLLRATLLRLGSKEHIFFLTLHHIIADGWSGAVLFREIEALYDAFSNDKLSVLPELSVQYADFAVWQRQWLTGQTLETQLSYWRKQLGEQIPVLELPTDRPRPPVQTYRGESQCLELSTTLSEKINTLCIRQGVTLFMTLLAALKVLFHRLTGQDDIVVGSPVANRNHSEIEGLIGFFVNTLVLRTDLSGNPTFRQLLNRIREVALGAYAHQDLPFEKLVEELRPERDLSRTPLFQVFFNMLNFERAQFGLRGLMVESFELSEFMSKFDLMVSAEEQDKRIKLRLIYNTDLFDHDRIAEMLLQFRQLIIQIVERPDERIIHFPMVTPQSKLLLPNPSQSLRFEWEGSVHTRVSQQAERLPANAAVVYANEVWSYAKLDACSNQLANYLRTNDIRSQDVVAIYGHRSASLVMAILGALKAGAAFAIMDPAFPAARLVAEMQVARPRGWIQLCDTGQLPVLLRESVETIGCRLGLPPEIPISANSLFRDYSTDDPDIAVEPDGLAYIAFTSASSGGKPKGIRGTHRPLSHFLKWHCETFRLDESDRFSMLSGLAHDPLLRDVFTPLWLGATLCIPEQTDIETPGKLSVWMRRERISIAHLTPAMGHVLTNVKSEDSIGNEQITSLRYVFSGGDVLRNRDVDRIRKLAPNITCVNFYGATETPQAMGYFIIPDLKDEVRTDEPMRLKENIPIGKGIEDAQLLVLNTAHQLAGIGEIGEIHIRTPYLSKGYIDDEVLTAEKFISNPFAAEPGDHLYKSGDLGRYLPDGNIEFLGRADRQVKIRGFRIELGEIESALSSHQVIKQCTAMVSGNGQIDRKLVAYIVCEEAISSLSLRRFLKETLPDYMIPSQFVQIDAIPLTPNGKVNYGLLTLLAAKAPVRAEGCVRPSTSTEIRIAEIWRNVIGVDKVGLHDNFFDLGGHSLMVVKTISIIEKELGKHMPFREFFNQTLKQFSTSCEEKLFMNEHEYAKKYD